MDLSLKANPFTKDITLLFDDRAIKNAVQNLIVSNFFERPFQPLLGANLRSLLFEPADHVTKVKLKESISRVIKQSEPRVELTAIIINDLPDNNAYDITIKYIIKELQLESEVDIQLTRLR